VTVPNAPIHLTQASLQKKKPTYGRLTYIHERMTKMVFFAGLYGMKLADKLAEKGTNVVG
jgi:hypothetical protein